MTYPANMPPESELIPSHGWRFPSVFTILIVLVAALICIIPAGLYDPVPSKAPGKDVPVADSNRPTEANLQGLLDVILAPIAGFYDPHS